MVKKALLIEFDVSTGKRPGNITAIDPHLRCHGWQKLDVVPALEIRIITDDRDIAQYDDLEGVTLLEGSTAINDAIDGLELEKHFIEDETLFKISFDKKKVNTDAYDGWKTKDVLKDLYHKKVLGVGKSSPKRV